MSVFVWGGGIKICIICRQISGARETQRVYKPKARVHAKSVPNTSYFNFEFRLFPYMINILEKHYKNLIRYFFDFLFNSINNFLIKILFLINIFSKKTS